MILESDKKRARKFLVNKRTVHSVNKGFAILNMKSHTFFAKFF